MSLSRRNLLLSVLGVVALNQLPVALAAPAPAPEIKPQVQPKTGPFTVSYWFKEGDQPWRLITVVQHADHSATGYIDGIAKAKNDFTGHVHFEAAFELGQAIALDSTKNSGPLQKFYNKLSAHYQNARAMFDELKVVRLEVTSDGQEQVAQSPKRRAPDPVWGNHGIPLGKS